jgi:geranylgeranyl diphosphate synthase type II
LIHDDLPAMDDDDLRRGKPTNHMVFGEAISILAGDGLLNLAYETMLRSCHPNTLDAMRVIAKRSGVSGMIAGQTADILLSGQTKTKNGVTYIHQHKTADLITASVVAGFVLAGVGDNVLLSADEYGKYLGFAFQISDDLLDLTGDPLLTGKASQRDELLDKVTWPAVVGQKRAKIDAEDAVNRAIKAAEHFGNNKAFFQSLAMSLLNRVK